MKILNLLFFIVISCNLSFAQFDKKSCQETVKGLIEEKHKYIVFVNSVSASNSYPTIIDAPSAKWTFKDTYLICEGAFENQNGKRKFIVPYGNIIFISGRNDKRGYESDIIIHIK